MMKNNLVATTKRLCLFVVLFINFKVDAQYNLVNNPSFEDYVVCPTNFNSPPPKNWYNPSNFVTDYNNACSNPSIWGVPYNTSDENYQYARTGNGYIHIMILNFPPSQNYREYYQTKLKDSLKKDKYYHCEFYVVNSNYYYLKCNNISALLSKTAVRVDTVATPFGVLNANPQITNYGNPIINDTLNWVKVSGIYKAEGGEQYLTLGNFKDDAHTNYFASQPTGYNGAAVMIDDVSVIPLDSMCLKAEAGRDTTITIGDSIFIGSYTNGIDSLRWLQGTTVIDSTRPGFWVKPSSNTFYVLHQVINGCFSSDTVYINVQPLPLKFISYSLSLRGTKQSQFVENIWQTANEINVSHFNIQRSLNAKDFKTIGKVKANNKSYNEYTFSDYHPLEGLGVGFYYRIQSIDKDGKINYSEIRIVKTDKLNTDIQVYPNPSNGIINIKLPLLLKGDYNVKITDILGKQLVYKIIKEGNINTQINIPAKGICFINIINTITGKILSQKLIIN